MSTIKLPMAEWEKIKAKLQQENKPATMLIRAVMARDLGFTTRAHSVWAPNTGYDGYGEYVTEMHLDFVDKDKELIFRLKYL